MRIGTAFAHLSSSAMIMDAQVKMYSTQNQLSTGKKVSSPSDDPVNASQIVTAQASVSRQASFSANQSYLEGELRQLELTLGSVGDTISTARETLVAGGNGAFNNSDRRSIANSLSSLRAQLVSLGNTRGSDGQHLFSGFQSNMTPFSQSGAAIVYAGDAGTRGVLVANGLAIQSNADGQSLFMQLPTGNGTFATSVAPTNVGNARIDTGTVTSAAALTGQNYEIRLTASATIDVVNTTTNTLVQSQAYVAGQAISFDGMQMTLTGTPAIGDKFVVTQGQSGSVFDALDQAITALNTTVLNDTDRAKVNDAIRQASASMEQAFDVALAKRSEVGGRMNALETASRVGAGLEFESKSLLSTLQDLDYAEAASRFASQQTGLQAALAAYAQTSKMSLFDYIR
ncbi:MAG: flagellar hook-associated protein FlgL [Aeromicrobium sp.]|nr:flagellar hook-associated protein FlgL [Burkholderiales bacterium]